MPSLSFLILLLLISLGASKDTFDIDIDTTSAAFPFLHIYNCDKDGASVIKRLASCAGGYSDTRDPSLRPQRFVDNRYVAEMGDKVAQYYKNISTVSSSLPKIPLNLSTIVLGNPHRASLYTAEVLHAPLLPMQFIGWAKSLDAAADDGSCLRIAGSDFDNPSVWLWNKITELKHFPTSYIEMITNAQTLVVVRSTDNPEAPESYLGRYKGVYIHSSIKANPTFLNSINQALLETNISNETSKLHQWEWGLPDQTIETVKTLWTNVLRKPAANLYVIEGGTVPLFRGITRVWQCYLSLNKAAPRGLSFNPYWTANPLYERLAGILPLDFYNFGVVQPFAQKILNELKANQSLVRAGPERVYAFMDTIETMVDVDRVKAFWDQNNLTSIGYFSIGYDLLGSKAVNRDGLQVDSPYQMIGKWLAQDANLPYKNVTWVPLAAQEVQRIFKATP